MKWGTNIKNLIQTGDTSREVYLKSTVGVSLVDIKFDEKRYPWYLHKLFRYSNNTIGCKVSFFTISFFMNKYSRVNTYARDDVNLTRHQLNNWLNDNGCKEISPGENPLDTSQHKRLSFDWVWNHITKLSSLFYCVAYLDEDFYYTTLQRHKLKQFPFRRHERDVADRLVRP